MRLFKTWIGDRLVSVNVFSKSQTIIQDITVKYHDKETGEYISTNYGFTIRSAGKISVFMNLRSDFEIPMERVENIEDYLTRTYWIIYEKYKEYKKKTQTNETMKSWR